MSLLLTENKERFSIFPIKYHNIGVGVIHLQEYPKESSPSLYLDRYQVALQYFLESGPFCAVHTEHSVES